MTIKQVEIAAPDLKVGQVWEAEWSGQIGRCTILKVRTKDVHVQWHRLDGKKVNSQTWGLLKSKFRKLISSPDASARTP